MTTTDRARAYLAKLPLAIAGQGGHAATFRAACRLVEFGLGEVDALELLREWNLTHCQPSWNERELRHKLADAFHRTSPKGRFTALQMVLGVRCPRLHAGKSPPPPRVDTPGLRSKSLLSNPRASFLRPAATPVQFRAPATLRGLSLEGVRLAYERSLLRFGMWRNRPAWFILDTSRRVAQARPRIHPDAVSMFAGKRVRIFPHVDGTGEDAVSRWAEQLAEAGADVDAFSFAGLRRADGAAVKDLNDVAAVHPDDFHKHPCLQSLFPHATRV